jgi:hypothetical protein
MKRSEEETWIGPCKLAQEWAFVLQVNVDQRASTTEALNHHGQGIAQPTGSSQPLFFSTAVLAQWSCEQSSHGGRDSLQPNWSSHCHCQVSNLSAQETMAEPPGEPSWLHYVPSILEKAITHACQDCYVSGWGLAFFTCDTSASTTV